MDRQPLQERKHVHTSIFSPGEMYPYVKALASPQRLKILEMLGTSSMYVNEIADRMGIPASTAAHNIRVLEEAGLISCEQQPGQHGTGKLCHRRSDSISLSLVPREENHEALLTLSLPVGCYSFAEEIAPTCGLASAHHAIGEDDNPRTFFCGDRFSAQLLWFRHGFVTYHFAVLPLPKIDVQWLELSFEACSEAPMYRDPWKSDISVSVNDCPLGAWVSPCDCGGRRGLLNPPWWSDMSTQYGMLKTWRVDKRGTYLEKIHLSDVTLSDLDLMRQPYIAVKIGVSPQAEHVGGLNLFGQGFGDFQQDIVLRIGYEMR